MPEPVNTETIVVTPTTPNTETAQAQTREALYQQYYNNQNPTPDPVAQSVTPDPAASGTSAAAPDYQSLFAQLQAEIAGLKNTIANTTQVPTEPVIPKEDWFALLQSGKRTEAEQALIQFVTNSAAQQIKQQTLVESAELNRTERVIEDFNNSIRAENPDLLDVEDFVSLKAEQIFRANQANIKSTKDYIAAYQGAVKTAVQDVRKVLQRTRAVAKAEAMTTQREVLATQTISPNDFALRDNRAGQQDSGQPQIPDTSSTSYIEMRKQNADSKRNPYMANNRQTVGL
jgi:hypothetical protein